MNPRSLTPEQREAARIAVINSRGDATNISGTHSTLYSYYFFSTPRHPICAIGFVGRAIKPSLRYRYPTEQARLESIDRWITGLQQRDAERAKSRQRTAEAIAQASPFAPGDVLYTSWGYEQTNVDFYRVVALHGRATVELIALRSNITGDGIHAMAGYATPGEPDPGAAAFCLRRSAHGLRIAGRYSLRPWTGAPVRTSWYG
jgi:hypothetical protein